MAKKDNCKLYRSFYEIIHPSISRKNISEYKIVFKEDIIPVQVFYPKKEIALDNIMIYIPGNNAYNGYYENMAIETNQVIILLDKIIDEDNVYFNTIDYIITEAKECGIELNNITIISDFKGIDNIIRIKNDLSNKKYNKIRKILLSPNSNDLEEYDLKNTLVLSNNEELTENNKVNSLIIKESIYDFVSDINSVTNEGIYLKINDFIENEEV